MLKHIVCYCPHNWGYTAKVFHVHIETLISTARLILLLTIALHVSGIIITHLQEHKTTVTTASGNRYTVLLSVAIVEEVELI